MERIARSAKGEGGGSSLVPQCECSVRGKSADSLPMFRSGACVERALSPDRAGTPQSLRIPALRRGQVTAQTRSHLPAALQGEVPSPLQQHPTPQAGLAPPTDVEGAPPTEGGGSSPTKMEDPPPLLPDSPRLLPHPTFVSGVALELVRCLQRSSTCRQGIARSPWQHLSQLEYTSQTQTPHRSPPHRLLRYLLLPHRRRLRRRRHQAHHRHRQARHRRRR